VFDGAVDEEIIGVPDDDEEEVKDLCNVEH